MFKEMLFIGIILCIFTVIEGDDTIKLLGNSTNESTTTSPIIVNLNDVVLSINILKMRNGEMLKIRPMYDKKYEIYATNVTDHFIQNDDDCVSGNCKNNSNKGNSPKFFKSAIAVNDIIEVGNEDDTNINSGKTINLFSAPALATTKDVLAPGYWIHADQLKWPTTFPNCGGIGQSPIDIPESVPILNGVSCLKWEYYHSAHRYLTLNNDGHTVHASSTWASGGLPTLSGGVLTGSYRLAGVHWHWGRDSDDGSEHSFQSRKYPLEMHLVHYNTQYANLEAALTSGNSEALAVIGVLFKVSLFSNPGISHIVSAMKSATLQGPQSTVLPLADLGVNFGDGYYTYLGSLTSPPCNQVVRWIVLKRILHIRENQLKVFRSVQVNGKPLVDIYRMVQPLNGRLLQFVNRCT